MFTDYLSAILRSFNKNDRDDCDDTASTEPQKRVISRDVFENLMALEGDFSSSGDLTVKSFTSAGIQFAVVSIENMIDKMVLNQEILLPLHSATDLPEDGAERFSHIYSHISESASQKQVNDLDDAIYLLCSGWGIIFIEGCDKALGISAQGFKVRAVDQPANEVTERGSRESFVEAARINTTLIRRRMKTSDLVFENLRIGKHSNTDVILCYLSSAVSPEILRKVRRKLRGTDIDNVLDSGYLTPFLEDDPASIWSSVGTSERPDKVCAKISEGRIAVIVDGTPFCLIVPYLFSENFQNFDDYTLKPYFATFIRCIKMLSFFISILLPGIYVALGTYNPEILPVAMLYKIVDAENITPFPLLLEALVIHVIYEIMREAGLRLPNALGHAVSIVGALVIGEAAVTAGLIGAPMIMVVAITALSSFVVPTLYYPGVLLRFGFIIVGGTLGIYGVMLLLSMAVINILSLNPYGVPFSSPVAPFDAPSVRDTVIRAGWRTLAKKTIKLQNLHGTERPKK